jgi:hypothetical protein
MDLNNKINNNSVVVFENTDFKVVGLTKQYLTGITTLECVELRNDVDEDLIIDSYPAWTDYN